MPETAQKLDFKKYRTPELAASVTEIVDVWGKFAAGFLAMFGTFVIFLLLAGLLFWNKGNGIQFGLTIGYSIFAGGIFGLAMAIVWTVKQSLSEMEQLVQLLFSTTNQVAQDVTRLGQGSLELPSARKLVEGVYGDVLLPVVEQVVASSLGFLGTPLLFAYRVTLGRVARTAIRLVPDTALAESDSSIEAEGQAIMSNLSEISDRKSQILTTLIWAQNQLSGLGTKAKFLVLLPCYVISVVAVSAVLLPLIILYFW